MPFDALSEMCICLSAKWTAVEPIKSATKYSLEILMQGMDLLSINRQSDCLPVEWDSTIVHEQNFITAENDSRAYTVIWIWKQESFCQMVCNFVLVIRLPQWIGPVRSTALSKPHYLKLHWNTKGSVRSNVNLSLGITETAVLHRKTIMLYPVIVLYVECRRFRSCWFQVGLGKTLV